MKAGAEAVGRGTVKVGKNGGETPALRGVAHCWKAFRNPLASCFSGFPAESAGTQISRKPRAVGEFLSELPATPGEAVGIAVSLSAPRA